MPLNDDLVLGNLTDPKRYPGDSQEDMNVDLLMTHDQNLVLKYVRKRIGRYTLQDLLSDLKDCDNVFWEKVLKRIIQTYNLSNLQMYITDTPIDNFAKHVSDLLNDLKVTLMDKILEGEIKRDVTREDLEKTLKEINSLFLRWSINFITQEDFEKFINQVFSDYKSPMYMEGDDT